MEKNKDQGITFMLGFRNYEGEFLGNTRVSLKDKIMRVHFICSVERKGEVEEAADGWDVGRPHVPVSSVFLKHI